MLPRIFSSMTGFDRAIVLDDQGVIEEYRMFEAS
jgi:hypothetical protein